MHKEQQMEFVQSCNRSLGVGYHNRLNQIHLQKLSKQLGLTPIAYFNVKTDEGTHWTLVVGRTDEGIEVYDPKIGLYKVKSQEVRKIWYFPENGRRQHVPEYFFAHSYKLPREKLEELGVLQENTAGNCGQLCVFAANYAKGIKL